MGFKKNHRPEVPSNKSNAYVFKPDNVTSLRIKNKSAPAKVEESSDKQVQKSSKPKNNSNTLKSSGREPNSSDKQQLLEFELYIAALKLEKDNALERVEQRTNDLIGPSEQTYDKVKEEVKQLKTAGKKTEANKREKDLLMLGDYLDIEKDKMMKEVWQISNAITEIKKEKEGYLLALDYAVGDEPIIWHTSQIGYGWLPEHFSVMQKSAEASPFYQMGFRAGTYYGRLRKEGVSLGDAIEKVTLLTLGDLSGISGIAESVTGRDIASDEKLSTEDRILRGVLGIISVASLAKIGMPRINGFLKKVSGTKIRLMKPQLQTSMGSIGSGGFVVLVGDGAVLALSKIEIQILAANGLLNMSAMQSLNMSVIGGSQKVAGLKNTRTGKYRGGGGSEEDRAYAKQVTGDDKATYVDDVEFDGHDTTNGKKVLLDAKRSSGKGSWYDMSGTDNFTIKFKQKYVLKQAKRQVKKIKVAGATHIEWHISNEYVAKHMHTFLSDNGIKSTQIKVIFTPMK